MSSLQAHLHPHKIEAGVDEAGRGCLAGPVVAAAVILPKNYTHKLLNDSKKLSEKHRILLRKDIEEKALCYAVSFVDHKTIDRINILNASFLAMQNAIEQLQIKPEFLLIDGNRFKTSLNIDYSCEIKGDARFMSIAAASILAKTHRDDYMAQLDAEFSCYGWKQNKGYPTKAHRAAIISHGSSKYHRKSFALLPKQLDLFKAKK